MSFAQLKMKLDVYCEFHNYGIGLCDWHKGYFFYEILPTEKRRDGYIIKVESISPNNDYFGSLLLSITCCNTIFRDIVTSMLGISAYIGKVEYKHTPYLINGVSFDLNESLSTSLLNRKIQHFVDVIKTYPSELIITQSQLIEILKNGLDVKKYLIKTSQIID